MSKLTRLTYPVGVTTAPEVHADTVASYRLFRLGKYTLNDLTDEFVLFHHSLIFTVGGLNTDPVLLCYAENDIKDNERPIAVTLQTSILSGLIPPYNHTIYGALKEHWKKVSWALDTIGAVNAKNKHFWRSMRQLIPIPDPSNNFQISTVPVNFISIDGNTNCWYWKPPSTTNHLVQLAVDKPLPETIKFSSKLFKET